MKTLTLFVILLTTICIFLFYGESLNAQIISANDSLKIVEKVYLHVDRESYYPGDDIWFKAYLIDASESFLSSYSINLHVELISPDSKIIDSRIIKLDNGLGNGDFPLSVNLKSGRYRLRAYTNYMRNFEDQLFFSKEITIINSSDAAKSFSDSSNYNRNKLEISFFPEGGSLVENVSSIVAFKAVDENGYGHDVSGEIYSTSGEKVTEFRSTHNGMGSFSLNPARGLSYFALTKSRNGDSMKYDIPKSFPKGVILNISKNQTGHLSIIFRTNPETFPLVTTHDLSVKVSARNIPMKTYFFRMKSLNSFFNLPTDDLPDGIIMLTLSGADNIPLCERMAFIRNKDEVKVKIETEKTEYRQRDSVCVKISLKADSTSPQVAFLSLSATDNFFTNNSSGFTSNISSWFLLESDVRGPVEEPSYYFDPSNPDRLKDLDLLLLTQGWRDFRWKYDRIFYPPEYGFTISGRIRKIISDTPIRNSNINIAIFKTGNPFITTVQSDSSGRFCVKGLDLSGKAKLIGSATSGKDHLHGWLILDSLSYLPPTVRNLSIQKAFLLTETDNQIVKENISSFVQYSEMKKSISKKYRLSDTVNIGEVTITAKRQDSPAESSAHQNLKTLFADREMKITPQEEKYGTLSQLMNVKFNNISISGVRIKDPLYLLDGAPTVYDAIAAIPVSMIERVDILGYIEGFRSFGERGAGGVMSFTTRNDWGSHSINYHSANVKLSGYNEPRIFYSPKHHNTLEKDFKPDLRTTLFWEPDIKIETNKDYLLNYYNADNSAEIKIIVEGITSNGIPFTGKTEYEVK